MYQAIVVACMIANVKICVTFEGQQWFDTERACKVRALDMASDVHEYYKGYKAVKYNCRALPNGILSK
jgi:predicted peroxiredoxin